MAESTPEEIITAAEQEIADAEALTETLEQRVLEGDESVTAEQVEQARGLRRFAQLRREAAQRKAAALAERRAGEDAERFLTEHLTALEGRDADLAKRYAKIRPLIGELLDAVREYDVHVFALARAATTPGSDHDPESNPELVGSAQLPEYAWAQARGRHYSVLMAGGALRELLTPFGERVPSIGRYSSFREFLQ